MCLSNIRQIVTSNATDQNVIAFSVKSNVSSFLFSLFIQRNDVLSSSSPFFSVPSLQYDNLRCLDQHLFQTQAITQFRKKNYFSISLE